MVISAVSDAVFCFFCAFFLSFFVFGYFTEPTFAAVFSALIGIVCAAFCFKFLSEKRKKKSLDKADRKNCDGIAFALSLLEPAKIKNLFFDAFYKKGENPKRIKNGILLEKSGVFFLPDFSPCGADKEDVIRAFNGIKEDQKAIVCCISATNEVKKFAQRFSGKVKIEEKEYAYVLLKETDLLPKPFICQNTEKKLTAFFGAFLKREKTRGFFLSGLFFFVTGAFVRLKIYYYIFGALLICLAAACRAFGKKLKD